LSMDTLHDQNSVDELSSFIHGFIMTQMTAGKGIQKHGQKAIDALYVELCQLDNKNVFDPLHASSLTTEQKRQALHEISLIKEKRSGDLKGHMCADGSTQRSTYSKDETASPTVGSDPLMIFLMIDAIERRDVATADVVGAYLWASMDDFVILKVRGRTVELLCKANPRYKEFVLMENGQMVLYLWLLKALYGCIKSALLWYKLFLETLETMGFILNPYDACIANKIIGRGQCTVAWHVDDMKISHVDANTVTQVIEWIEEKFGKMTVVCGKKHPTGVEWLR